MTELIKCTALPGGYSATQCEALKSVADYYATKSMKGIFFSQIVNVDTFEKKGTMVKSKQGKHLEHGLVFNYCPYCGGKLRDTSED